MKCEQCGTEMYIDSWMGWIWICVICGNKGRKATEEEIEKNEQEYEKLKEGK